MKKTIIKILAFALALCLALPLIVACAGAGTETSATKETQTKRGRPTTAETDEETETPEETNNRSSSSICYVGEDASSPKSVFFDTLDEAVAAYPDGAVIKFCKASGVVVDKPFHFPETGNFVLDFNNCQVDITFDAGIVLECKVGGMKQMQYAYYRDLESVLANKKDDLQIVLKPSEVQMMDPYVPYLWVFGETDGMTVGRYAISDLNAGVEDADPDFRYERVEDLSLWGVPYVAVFDGHYFYDLQAAMDACESSSSLINMSILNNCSASDENNNEFVLPISNYYYRIAYDYSMVHGSFDTGVTFDDGAGGYCYYSSLSFLAGRSLNNNSVVWIWGTMDGYEPGKYILTITKPEDKEMYRENGDAYIMVVGNYTFTRVDGVNADTFFKEMEENYQARLDAEE